MTITLEIYSSGKVPASAALRKMPDIAKQINYKISFTKAANFYLGSNYYVHKFFVDIDKDKKKLNVKCSCRSSVHWCGNTTKPWELIIAHNATSGSSDFQFPKIKINASTIPKEISDIINIGDNYYCLLKEYDNGFDLWDELTSFCVRRTRIDNIIERKNTVIYHYIGQYIYNFLLNTYGKKGQDNARLNVKMLDSSEIEEICGCKLDVLKEEIGFASLKDWIEYERKNSPLFEGLVGAGVCINGVIYPSNKFYEAIDVPSNMMELMISRLKSHNASSINVCMSYSEEYGIYYTTEIAQESENVFSMFILIPGKNTIKVLFENKGDEIEIKHEILNRDSE